MFLAVAHVLAYLGQVRRICHHFHDRLPGQRVIGADLAFLINTLEDDIVVVLYHDLSDREGARIVRIDFI